MVLVRPVILHVADRSPVKSSHSGIITCFASIFKISLLVIAAKLTTSYYTHTKFAHPLSLSTRKRSIQLPFEVKNCLRVSCDRVSSESNQPFIVF
uniref:Uncharacterized protein n=1 Tax=Rhizophora mucronata TaxID=61149 RepID=A0A2P2MIQ2_RHIMU